MTPKEKAKELVNKFLKHNTVWIDDENYYYSEKKSKQCALIAVDLALQVEFNCFKTKVQKSFWQEVKQEIERL